MAAGDFIEFRTPHSMMPENGIPHDPALNVRVGNLLTRPLPKLDSQAYDYEVRIPLNGAPLTVGLTFQLELVADALNDDPGNNAYIGITCKRLVSGASDTTLTGAAAEVQQAITLPATSGNVVTATFAIANANLPAGLVAGDRMLVRIRRNGSNALDTHRGRVLLLGASLYVS